MLKYIITLDCPRACEYCIIKNVPRVEPAPIGRIDPVLAGLSRAGETELMITGGEPTWCIGREPDRFNAAYNAGR